MAMLTRLLRRSISHTVEPLIEANYSRRIEQYHGLLQETVQPYQGYFSAGGMLKYRQRHPKYLFKKILTDPGMMVSSIGIGTYKGSLNEEDDLLMFNGIVDSLIDGVNLVDCCRNFRGGRSEIVIGKALQYLIEKEKYSREEYLIASKLGYVRQQIPNEVEQSDIINDHCVHPKFMEQQLNCSLKNMNLQTIDVYYLNNFAQCQLISLKQDKFESKLCQAFAFFERARQKGKIRSYGMSSWRSFRVDRTDECHLNLARIIELAEKVGGKTHGFKYLQVPINIMMPEAFADKHQDSLSLMEAAEKLSVNVISNSPLLSGSLINVPLSTKNLKCDFNGAKHLQLIRSVPSLSLISTLVGQKQNRHVRTNLQVLSVPPLNEDQWLNVFMPKDFKAEVDESQTF